MKTKLTSELYLNRMGRSKDPIEFGRNFAHYISFLNSRSNWAAQKYAEGMRQFNVPKMMEAIQDFAQA